MTHDNAILPTNTDYHVHCNADGCGHEEMTIENICSEAVAAGLQEICILKHYSAEMPVGGPSWGCWKRTMPEDLDAFLANVAATQIPEGLHVLTGVETEILNIDGTINIPHEEQAKIDLVQLSAHWLPESPVLPSDWKNKWIFPLQLPEEEQEEWKAIINEMDPALFVQEMATAYVQAIRHNPKVRVLAHMGDGMYSLHGYLIPVNTLPEKQLVDLMTPVMDACVEHNVLWEVTAHPGACAAVLHEANRRGVQFTATVDAHHLYSNDYWGHKVRDHHLAEQALQDLHLTRGRITLCS